MFLIILITIGIIILAGLIWGATRLVQDTQNKEGLAGICATALDQTVRKNGNKEKVLALFGTKNELSNSDIRDALGVSATSVVRYMDELEKEGKVEQIGTAGHAVTYRLR